MEIDCPADCVYLTGGHAPGWLGRDTERRRDARRLAHHVQDLGEPQAELLFLALAGIIAIHARRPGLTDALLAQAVAALRRTVETRSRGILYDHQADDVRAQGLVYELRGLFEATDEEGRSTAPDDPDVLAVLTALDASLAETLKENAGPTAFLETAARLAGDSAGPPRPRPSPLILEP